MKAGTLAASWSRRAERKGGRVCARATVKRRQNRGGIVQEATASVVRTAVFSMPEMFATV